MAHLEMLAALQPFISGTASKTVNLPNSATPNDIYEIYIQAWKLGLKCVSVYRDGSKGDQPVYAGEAGKGKDFTQIILGPRRNVHRPLPSKRKGITWKAYIGGPPSGENKGHKIYLRTGEYNDGNLGEIWLDTHKESSTLKGFHDALAMSISKGLSYGVPVEDFVNILLGMKFEPAGPIYGDDEIKMADSSLDYIARKIAIHYLGWDALAHHKPERTEEETQNLPSKCLPQDILEIAVKYANHLKCAELELV